MKRAFAASLAIAAAAAALTASMIIANIATTESIPYKVAEVPLEAAESTVHEQAIAPGEESRIPDPAIAWITIPGTTVDYPVVQASSDSPDFYLTHDASGKRSAWGAPYIHSGCREGMDSPLVVVLGHNMSDGTMFAPLANYSRRPFAQEHKTILVRTEEDTRKLEVFAVDVLDADGEGVVARFDGIDGLRSFIDDKLRSCEVVLSEPKDLEQAWCFVTCSYQTDNSRTAVYAMEVE